MKSLYARTQTMLNDKKSLECSIFDREAQRKSKGEESPKRFSFDQWRASSGRQAQCAVGQIGSAFVLAMEVAARAQSLCLCSLVVGQK